MSASVPKISFVSPVYKAAEILPELVSEIEAVMTQINEPYEIILVDDRSPDTSWSVMQHLSKDKSHVKSMRLSKNFGQHPAIMAGLSHAKGDWVVVMDCDLQDQPKEVLKLYNEANKGFDAVLAKRTTRQDSFLKRLSSKVFSKVYGFFTDTAYDNEVANFGIYSSKVISAILKVQDYIKFFPLFVNFVGFNISKIEVEHATRAEGESSYSFRALLSLALNTILSFSNKPLRIFVKFGMGISLLSFIAGIYTIYLSLTGNIEVMGYSSLIVSIWFLSGLIITIIGVTGIYVGKIFDQVKERPVYIIDEILNNE